MCLLFLVQLHTMYLDIWGCAKAYFKGEGREGGASKEELEQKMKRLKQQHEQNSNKMLLNNLI